MVGLSVFAQTFPDDVVRLRAQYDGMGHAYHNWAHIQAMLADFERVRAQIANPAAVETAIYFHDAIYVPGSGTNEADSADLMAHWMAGRMNAATLEAARDLILATASHVVADLPDVLAADCALLLDMDLAVLGAETAIFEAYDAGIRSEFASVPWEIYRPARRQVMQGFLERERLYLTETFHRSHDRAARENLTRLIHSLAVSEA